MSKLKQQIKGVIRRLFVRGELYQSVLQDAVHPTIKGKRGGRQYVCNICKNTFPGNGVQVDHIEPVIPIGFKIDDLDYNQIVDNIFCSKDNLQVVCKECHVEKCKLERKLRKG